MSLLHNGEQLTNFLTSSTVIHCAAICYLFTIYAPVIRSPLYLLQFLGEQAG